LQKSKRVLILSYLDYPFYAGMSRRISGLAGMLLQNNVGVKVLAPIARSPTVIKPDLDAEGIQVERIDLRSFSSKGNSGSKLIQWLFFTIIASIKTCKEVLRSRCLVQYQTVYSAGPALFAKLFLRATIIGDDVVLVNPVLDSLLLKLTDTTITPSLKTFQLAKRMGKDVFYVPNGVDKPISKTVGSIFKPNMVFVGSFSFDQNVKAVENIIDLAATLESEGLPFKITIIGGPIDRVSSFFDRDVVKNRVVEFLGNVSFNRLSQVYDSSSIGLLPFFCDIPLLGGQRTKALEFFANGLLVVSGMEGIEGIDGLVSERHFLLADSVISMSKILRRCLLTPNDCVPIAIAGQKFVSEKYSWGNLTKDYLKVIQSNRQNAT
jgi:glycosyltransferase involved in cell wall biosynthesis